MNPTDLIPIADAMRKTGRSRQWIEDHCTTYDVKNHVMVSESEAMTALEDWQKPKPRKKEKEEE